jgi:hypothetical protein
MTYRHYIVYHNEVRFVDPHEHPARKVRILLPPKARSFAMFDSPPDKIVYCETIGRMRFAVRRIRSIAFMGYLPEGIRQLIECREGIPRRRRLHDAEKEMKEADSMLAEAISKRSKFKEDLNNGVYDDGRIRTELAIKRDRETSQALSAARNRMMRAAHELYRQLVAYGTITEEEARRRMGAAIAWGSDVL